MDGYFVWSNHPFFAQKTEGWNISHPVGWGSWQGMTLFIVPHMLMIYICIIYIMIWYSPCIYIYAYIILCIVIDYWYIYIYIWLYIPLTIQLRIHGQGSTAGSFAMNHPVMLDWYHGKVLVIQWFQLCHYDVYTIEYCHVCPSQTKCPKKIFTIWGEKTRKNGDFWGWCIEKTGLGT